MTEPQMIIRQHELPHKGGCFSRALTGQWTVLHVDNRFGVAHLFVLEELEGPKSEIEFHAVATKVPVSAALVSGSNVYLGSYAAPGNMFHVFGPKTSRIN